LVVAEETSGEWYLKKMIKCYEIRVKEEAE